MRPTVHLSLVALCVASPATASGASVQEGHQNAVIDLWMAGEPAFGVYVPSEGQPLPGQPAPARGEGRAPGGSPDGERPAPRYTREIGEALARNPLYDYVFLNLEGAWDATAVRAIHDGLQTPSATGRKTLLVRIPSIADAGVELTGHRIRQAFDLGADGVILPHVRGVDEAREAIGLFEAATDDIWSPDNPRGEKVGMLMVEDPESLLDAGAIAELAGYSMLACGIGSMGRAFRDGGVVEALVDLGLVPSDQARELGELATQKVLEETKRVGLPNMLTANPETVERRVAEGFLALLMQGPTADEAIRLGRAAAGR